MYGAIIGDIVGSIYEFIGFKSKEFPFTSRGCSFTDDSVMTVAVAKALIDSVKTGVPFKKTVVEDMQAFGRQYPDYGYGGRFNSWLYVDDPAPYNSYGNGSAMRVSPCGLIATTLDEAVSLGRASAEVTHNHFYGIQGAEVTAGSVFLAKSGKSKDEIKAFVENDYYILNETLDEIRPSYEFNETCQDTVPQAIQAFMESTDYEDAIRNAISLGGDADTLAAITGSIAWAYYYHDRADEARSFIQKYGIIGLLPYEFKQIINEFDDLCKLRMSEFDDKGTVKEITI